MSNRLLPFYKMYPADADTDENFRLMTFEQRGMYWTLLNHSWLNNGLPSDLTDLRDLCRMPQEDFERCWFRVSRCFELVDNRLRNPRQEVERVVAKTKSECNTNAVRKRWDNATNVERMNKNQQLTYERTTNESIHAIARASASVSVSEEERFGEKEISEAVERMYSLHPKKSYLALIPEALLRAVNGGPDISVKLAEIENCHAAWVKTDNWKKSHGQFAPRLDLWLSDRGYTQWPEGTGPPKPRQQIDPSRLSVYDPTEFLKKEK